MSDADRPPPEEESPAEEELFSEETPAEIGPYRLLRRLGRGGMGEVFEAYDPRLDRRVAIKRLRTDSLSAVHLERFRREARIGAGLVHSGIVQVFDVTRHGDHEYLVMELVPGPSLRQRLGRGPMGIAEAVALARDVAAALAYAHRRGVIHRDLKTENILLAEDEGAKIADFGIARQQPSAHRRIEDPTLTGTGLSPGTVRAMAPEQALGEGLDHRADLFAFGVLFYEMLTGVSPFRAESDVATLGRVVSRPHPPIRRYVPDIPAPLEALIDQLLEKEPALRPRDADEVLRHLDALSLAGVAEDSVTEVAQGGGRTLALEPGSSTAGSPERLPEGASPTRGSPLRRLTGGRRAVTLALLGVLAVLLLAVVGKLRQPNPPQLHVAVAPPVVEGSLEGDRATLLAHAVRGALQRTLVSLGGLSPRPFAEIDALDGGTASLSPTQIARALAVDELVLASLDCRGSGCTVELSRVDGASGGVLWTTSLEVRADDLPVAARAVGHRLAAAFPERSPRQGAPLLEVETDDYEAFLRVYEAFYSTGDDSRSQAALLDQLRAIHRTSPRFLDAWLLAGEVALSRFARRRDPEDLALARRMANRSAELAPGDPASLLLLLRAAFEAGDLDHAEETLARLDEISPGDAHLLGQRARLLEARGEPAAALALLRDAAQRQPSTKTLYNLALTAQRQGELDTAREALERLLRAAPNDYRGRSLLAQIELVAGDAARAVELYRRLVQHSPGAGELSNLGLALTLVGDYEAATAAYRRVVEQAPANPFFRLNLADALWLAGAREPATEQYRWVLEQLAGDPATTTWQHHSVRAQALAHLGASTKAVVAIQKALRLAPDNGHVAFEAALVYTLLEDYASATANAQRSLALGFDAGWFRLPWFDPIRDRLGPEAASITAEPAESDR